MMHRFLYLLLLPFCLSAQIVNITSMTELPALLESKDADETLLVFDIDQTLVMFTEPAFQRPNYAQHRNFFRSFPEMRDPFFMDMLSYHMIADGAFITVEPCTATVVNELQELGYLSLALTASLANNPVTIVDMDERRAEHLQRLGISFASAFAEHGPITFDEFAPHFEGHPTFKHGILISNGHSTPKSQVLLAFLDRVQHAPKRVVFVEDTHENLIEMQVALAETGIDYLGVHYTGANHFAAEEISAEALQARWMQLYEETRRSLEAHQI